MLSAVGLKFWKFAVNSLSRLEKSLRRPFAIFTLLCVDFHSAERNCCSAAIRAWASNQPPVALPLMQLNLVKRKHNGAALVPALMLDLLSNSEGQQALAVAHDTSAGWADPPSLTPQLVEAGDTNQMTLGASGYWSFPRRHQAHRALNQFSKLHSNLSFSLASFLLHFSPFLLNLKKLISHQYLFNMLEK